MRGILWLSLCVVPVVVALTMPLDYDLWWHLRCGQWVIDHGTVPTTDPFSQFGLATGKPWYAYSWLYEVLLVTAYRTAGFHGLLLVRAALTLLMFGALQVLVLRRTRNFLAGAALLGLATLAMLPLITDRPWLLTILFSAATLDVVLDMRQGLSPKRLWLLPLVFVAWANLHIQFVFGLMVLGLACLAPLVDRLLRREIDGSGAARAFTPAWWKLVMVTVLCAAATLATPYHVHLYAVVAELALHKVPTATVAEFQSLEFRNFWDWCVLALGAWATFALGRRVHSSSFEVLLLIVAAWFAFKGRRDIWMLVLAALAIVPGMKTLTPPAFLPSRLLALAVAATMFLLLAGSQVWSPGDDTHQQRIVRQYPVEAAEFVRREAVDGPLYNSFDWGGYLIWALPEHPVAMDGRTNLHTDERIARHLDTWLGRPGWDADPELSAARVVIAERRLPLTTLLRGDERFRVAHEDDVAVVFVAR